MKRKILLALGLALALTLCVSAALAAGVAKIGTTEYATIDAAIDAANAGDTIVLLDDVKATKTFYKSLTFTGGHALSMDCYGWRYSGDLVFDGADFVINTDAASPVANNGEAGKWFTMVLSGSITAKNNANVKFSFDSACGTNCAIYAGARGVRINVEKASSFIIFGKNTRGVSGQGIQLDSTANTGIFVTGGSQFLIEGTNRGYVNSPEIYVEDSTFTVQYCTANGSNGGKFTAVNSKINYMFNRGHGLSATILDISKGSVLNCTGNGYYGVTVSSMVTMDGTSSLTANENGWGYTGGGFRLASSQGKGNFAAGGTVTVCSNDRNGVENYGALTFADGVKMTVTGNYEPNNGGGIYNGPAGVLTLPANAVVMRNEAGLNGGGICNKGELVAPASVKLYNNHAGTAGDDIWSNNAITFGRTGEGWKLDGLPDCYGEIHAIDGWYEDGENAQGLRWNADALAEADRYIHWYDCGTYQDTTIALKAAHDVIPEPVTPPQSGDNSKPLMWLCMLLACAACLTVLRVSRKRHA